MADARLDSMQLVDALLHLASSLIALEIAGLVNARTGRQLRHTRLIHATISRTIGAATACSQEVSFEKSDSGALPNSLSPNRISHRRIPLAVTVAFPVVAFRTIISVGPRSNVTIADGVTIALYYAAVVDSALITRNDLNRRYFQVKSRCRHASARCRDAHRITLGPYHDMLDSFNDIDDVEHYELGQGGFGRVIAVEDTRATDPNNLIAIKVSTQGSAMMINEARILNQLLGRIRSATDSNPGRHPSILCRTLFYQMAEALKCTPPFLLSITLEAYASASVLEEADIVHGDVKSENILFQKGSLKVDDKWAYLSDMSVKLADFGCSFLTVPRPGLRHFLQVGHIDAARSERVL
ncbi:hypothetical protein BKA62DRAFT_677579, partial [Auriculariales sp. MPI-PUGE-AT-0066]